MLAFGNAWLLLLAFAWFCLLCLNLLPLRSNLLSTARSISDGLVGGVSGVGGTGGVDGECDVGGVGGVGLTGCAGFCLLCLLLLCLL